MWEKKAADIKIIVKKLSDIDKKEYEKLKNAVPRDALNEYLNIKNETRRMEKIVGEGTVRLRLSEITKIPPRNIVIKKGEYGKPYFDGNIFFNISHSRGLMAFGISENETGIDIEKLRKVNFKASDYFFSENEREYVNSSKDEKEKTERFLKLWTLKESYLKCEGSGLKGDIKSCEFMLKDNKVIFNKNGYLFYAENHENEYVLSACEKIE